MLHELEAFEIGEKHRVRFMKAPEKNAKYCYEKQAYGYVIGICFLHKVLYMLLIKLWE